MACNQVSYCLISAALLFASTKCSTTSTAYPEEEVRLEDTIEDGDYPAVQDIADVQGDWATENEPRPDAEIQDAPEILEPEQIESQWDHADIIKEEVIEEEEETEPMVWRPRPGTSWQWQLTGTLDTTLDVVMYDIDLFDTPGSVINGLHENGRIVICYFSAGTFEEWRPDAGEFPAESLGRELDGWPGERWLDIRDKAVRDVMQKRLDLAFTKGCDGVEPDNVDGYVNDPGFPLTYEDQLDYNRFISIEAHKRGLSVGLKNDLDQIEDLLDYFDWALNEECFDYEECGSLAPFIRADKAVFQVEYGSASKADRICPKANAMNFDTLIKHIDLDSWRIACR